MDLTALVAHLDEYLETATVPDYPTALNGLQVFGARPIRKVALAVDASEQSIEAAIAASADVLIVHHGLFWDGLGPITGRRHRKLKACLAADLAVYASHIPLDLHREVGNSAVLARALGISVGGSWAAFKGVDIGVWGELEISREALNARLDDVLGVRVRLLPGGGERITKVGVVTGGGGGYIGSAIAAGLDAFITGEGNHHTYFDAVEGGINVYYGGHYATETWGVRALGTYLSERFQLETVFLDFPTGL